MTVYEKYMKEALKQAKKAYAIEERLLRADTIKETL